MDHEELIEKSNSNESGDEEAVGGNPHQEPIAEDSSEDTFEEIITPVETDTSITKDSSEETKVVEITEIDLGDYLKEMVIGEKQLLIVTLLPLEADAQKITYHSSDIRIASINGLGRIEALQAGSSTITVTAGEISQSFVLKVKEKEDNTIPVTDIEIGNHEAELEVGKTLTISGTVLPADATESTLTYTSSDSSIATVNSSGEVKGIRKGQVNITLSAGGISKSTSLRVTVPTRQIKLNNTYVVLKPGQEYRLTTTVIPEEAEQTISYKSKDDTVATVSEEGVITAKGTGNTTIFVSNEDTMTAVSVIVNESISKDEGEESREKEQENQPVYNTIIYASQQKIIDSSMLRYLYNKKKKLKIIGEGYFIEVDGKEIVNYDNEIYTNILMENRAGEIGFILNRGKELCGSIVLSLEEAEGKYLYLYNPSKEKYELIDSAEDGSFELTTAGEYKLSDEKIIEELEIIQYLIAGIISIGLTGSMVYIFTKKKYWFW